MEANKKRPASNNGKEFYLLSGKVYCKCSYAMSGNTHSVGRNKTKLSTYRCHSRDCHIKEINRDYLDDYVVRLMENEIFNRRSLKYLTDLIRAKLDICNINSDKRVDDIKAQIRDIVTGINNITSAVEKGLFSNVMYERLDELEEQKKSLESELSNVQEQIGYTITDDTADTILNRYNAVAVDKRSYIYKEYIQQYINRIEVDNFNVCVTLRTGLNILSSCDTVYKITRQEIYSIPKKEV